MEIKTPALGRGFYIENHYNKKRLPHKATVWFSVWSHLGLNQGLPDYESGALTN